MRQGQVRVLFQKSVQQLRIILPVLVFLFLACHLASCQKLPRLSKEYGKEIAVATPSLELAATP